MATNNVNYDVEKKVYYKVLIGLLLLTAITLVQPYIFWAGHSLLPQLIIAVIKAWLIIIYYMHLKGEKLITAMVWFTIFLVTVFFVIVIGVDIPHFQFSSESYIAGEGSTHIGGVNHE